jgi:hypothetical protein
MQKLATLIIAEHNEGPQLNESLDNLLKHNDPKIFDIVVVSDGSEIKANLDKYRGIVRHMSSAHRSGVGSCFDIGSDLTETRHMIIMGSDIRFREDNMVEKMIDHLEKEENEKSIICTTNLGINTAKNKTIYDDELLSRYGARICMFLTVGDLPKKGIEMGRLKNEKAKDDYRNILEAKWIKKMEGVVYELPCVLGAFYGVRTDWYKHIGGFHGHRYWGTLEPFISLKSWLAGGECKIATDIETGHLFKKRGSHFTRGSDLIYNKYAVSMILFGREIANVFTEFLGTNSDVVVAKNLIGLNLKDLYALHKRFMHVKTRDIHWFYEKFGFKYYDLIKYIKDEIRGNQ